MKPSNDILEDLSALRRADAEARAASVPLAEMMRRAAGAPAARDFAAAFAGAGVHVIAELKRASPSEGMIREDFRPVELAHELEGAGAAALSVLCEPHRFLGDERYLADVRRQVGIPVLYKDFITTRYQVAAARAAGADAVLLIAAVLDDAALADLLGFARSFGMEALVETHDAASTAGTSGTSRRTSPSSKRSWGRYRRAASASPSPACTRPRPSPAPRRPERTASWSERR